MQKLFIEETYQSPRVTIDPEKNVFEIRGNSFPNNAFRFYTPIIEWLDAYLESPSKESLFVFNITYQNSSSRKMFNEIFKRLEKMFVAGHKLKIDWYYEEDDEDIKQIIMEFKQLFKVEINAISVKEED
jgi:hypothetical protein